MGISIQDKVALVTGANRGIGKAIVETFLSNGARKVYLAARNPESTAALGQKYGDRVVALKFDAEDPKSIEELAESAKDVNIVVNNAGVLEIADPLSEHVEEALRYELEVNLFGLVRVAKAFAPILAEQEEAALVQLNSIASIKNFTDFSTYSASKAAAFSITQGLRDRLGEKGVQVLSVHPGPIRTDMADKAGFPDGEAVTSVSEGIVQALAKGDFLLFPDLMAREFQAAYQSYADTIINADLLSH